MEEHFDKDLINEKIASLKKQLQEVETYKRYISNSNLKREAKEHSDLEKTIEKFKEHNKTDFSEPVMGKLIIISEGGLTEIYLNGKLMSKTVSYINFKHDKRDNSLSLPTLNVEYTVV